MTEKNRLTIYEYLNRDGDPDAYVCSGHVDSMTFRDAVQQEFSVKPLVVQHRWRRNIGLGITVGRRDPALGAFITDAAGASPYFLFEIAFEDHLYAVGEFRHHLVA